MLSTLKKLFSSIFGKFKSKEELSKFLLLAVIFGLIIGTYWTLRPIKDSIFNAIVGFKFQPLAKILSLFVVAPLIIVYGKLIDAFSRDKVFYILTGIYSVLALVFMFAFLNPSIGLPNTVASSSRILGWLWYLFVESFGSLIVALFWALTTDITAPDAAKRGFPIIALMGQMGNILGPLILNTKVLGLSTSAPLVGICSVLIFLVGALLWVFMHVTPKSQLVGYQSEKEDKANVIQKKRAGFLEGLKLLLTEGYLLGIFFIISAYEIIITIVDYHFKTNVFATFPVEAHAQAFLAKYSWMTGVVATACILMGINNIQRKLGMKISLLLMPMLVAVAVVALKIAPGALYVGFVIMVAAKAINYALNQPTLKQLYIPTTKDTKYKAQAWIEMFGSRGSKAVGSFVNNFKRVFVDRFGAAAGVSTFLMLTTFASLSLVVVWFFVAIFVSKKFDKAIKDDSVVC